jgi:predicted PurR-regulated permease PerM
MTRSDPLRLLFAVAAVVVIIAGLRTASSIVVPFLLSVFLASICAPALFWMRRKRVPEGLALLLIIAVVVGALPLLGLLLGSSVEGFTSALPRYQERLQTSMTGVADWLGTHGLTVSKETVRQAFDPSAAMSLANQILGALQGLLGNVFLIVLTVVFILLEARSFPVKLRALPGGARDGLRQFDRLLESVKKYVAVKTIVSLLTGVSVGVLLLIVGVDFPVLWATLAFFLNYIPTVGSLIAAVPAVLLAVVQLGVSAAVVTAIGYGAVNTLFGNVLEPRIMGRSVGLSPLVVFLSLVFWGWVLGPVGMLLSVPLTMVVKIALEGHRETRGLALLLGTESQARAAAASGAANESGEDA